MEKIILDCDPGNRSANPLCPTPAAWPGCGKGRCYFPTPGLRMPP